MIMVTKTLLIYQSRMHISGPHDIQTQIYSYLYINTYAFTFEHQEQRHKNQVILLVEEYTISKYTIK
jgi:hypothetical protein